MNKIFLVLGVLFFAVASQAQFTNASLQASGLTCSMCSKAVKVALEDVDFVEKIQVDIKNQQYNLTFKKDVPFDIDDLSKAVIDPGFSVAALKLTPDVQSLKAAKDAHVLIGDQYFHFLNGTGQQLSGSTTFRVVDKSFVSAKDFKKFSAASKLDCVQMGKTALCCAKDNVVAGARVYHVII